LDGAGVYQHRAAGDASPDVVDVQRRKWWERRAEDVRPKTVPVAEAQEVGRVAAVPGEQQGDEGVLVRSGEQRVLGAFATDGRGALAVGRRGAERARAVGRVDGQVVGQREDPLLQRLPQRASQRLGLVGGDQVGAGDCADEQRAAREQCDRFRAVSQQPAQVLGRVTRGGDGAQAKAAEAEFVAVVEAAMGPLEAAGSRSEHGRAPGGELAAAGEEVGMQVGLDGERDGQAGAFGRGQVRGGLACRVDHEGAVVTEVDEVGRVAQSLVDEGDRSDRSTRHAGLVAATMYG